MKHIPAFSQLTRGDRYLITVLGLITLLSFVFLRSLYREGDRVIIHVEDRDRHIYPLNEDRTLTVQGKEGPVTIQIRNGEARILKSGCSLQYCVQMGAVKRSGQIVVCLPNRVYLRIDAVENRDLDAITM